MPKIAPCALCQCNDDRRIPIDGLVLCDCGHLKYHCCCKTEWWRNKPMRKKVPAEKVFGLNTPKRKLRPKKGKLVLDANFFRENGMESAALEVLAEQEQQRLRASEANLFDDPYHGEF